MHNAVRALRIERGLSQQELAEAMTVSRQTINSIERERYTPSLPLAIALARLLQPAVEEVFDADDVALQTWWFLPLFSTALGVACVVALWVGDERGRPGARSRS